VSGNPYDYKNRRFTGARFPIIATRIPLRAEIVFEEFVMHVVVVNSWKEETDELTQEIARTLGITAYEVKQRMLCGSPTVLVSYADPRQAQVLVNKLNLLGMNAFVVDAVEVRNRTGSIIVRHFKLNETSLRIETGDNRSAEIPYRKIDVLLPATSTVTISGTKTTTEKRFSLGKTLLTGGIPMFDKVTRQQEMTSEESKGVLYLYVINRREPVIFSQDGLTYEGLGEAMKLSRVMNFNVLLSELHRHSPGAAYDDRLLKRIGQIRLLGPTLNPDTHLDIAAEILVSSLRLLRNRERSGYHVPE
jgi:hypothetical protein